MTELNGVTTAAITTTIFNENEAPPVKMANGLVNVNGCYHHMNSIKKIATLVNGGGYGNAIKNGIGNGGANGNGYMSADEEDGGVRIHEGYDYYNDELVSVPMTVTKKVSSVTTTIHQNGKTEEKLREEVIPTATDTSTAFPTSPPPTDTTPFLETARSLNAKITAFLSADPSTLSDVLQATQKQTQISLNVIQEALERYQYEELAMSYNGGKDCLVLLILLLAGIVRWYDRYYDNQMDSELETPRRPVSSPPSTFPSVYVTTTHPFPEVDAFVTSSSAAYNLTLSRYPLPMKRAFHSFLSTHPSIRAIFVGTRRTDPHGGNLTFFDPTDSGWPSFMRCHPVIDWHYAEVWAFLRAIEVEYCCLYDRGYTSLGGTTDTVPNPVLATGEGTVTPGGVHVVRKFRPAYELLEDEQERLGRERR